MQPINPLVEVNIPPTLDQAIDLPADGVSITVGSAADRTASAISDGAAFYPNVAPESDLSILPTPTGVETLTQLRSPEAPTTQDFHLGLPADGTVERAEDGGAVISREDDVLMVVPPPTAIDASGEPVPVSLQVNGSTISIEAHPSAQALYPILVDPLFDSYSWKNSASTNGIFSDWRKYAPNPARFEATWAGELSGSFFSGLALRSFNGGITPGSSSNFNYYVPRYFTDQEAVGERPESYIRSMNLSQVYFINESPPGPFTPQPLLYMGLWNEKAGNWASVGSHSSAEGQWVNYTPPAFVNVDEVEDVKNGGIALASYESSSYPRQLYVGSATVEVSDKYGPGLSNVKSVPQWVGTQGGDVPYEATDRGLGVHDLRIRYPAPGGGQGEGVIMVGCTGAASSPCPRTSSSSTKPLWFDSNALAQGEDWVKVYAVDPIGHWSPAGESRIKVDHEAPTLALTGSITEQEQLGTRRATYSLKATGSDGNAEHPQSGIAKAEVKLDGKAVTMEGAQLAEWSPKCATRNCGLSAEWTLNTAGLAEGSHTVEVIATDAVGISTTKTVMIETHSATPPTLALSGSMTEQATLGTSRPRYVLKAKSTATAAGFEAPTLGATPTYSSSIGSFGTGNGQFYAPADAAVDAKGNLWALDKGNNRLQKFNEKGEWLLNAGSAGTGAGKLSAPSALALDSSGNVWVADTANNRVVEFNEKGEFVETFGTNVNKSKVEAAGTEAEKNLCTAASGNVCQAATAGSLAGQLKSPKGIAVTSGGNIWVADTANSRIEKFGPTGSLLNNNSGLGSEPGKLKEPAAITIAPDGSIWVADTGNNRIEQWNSSLTFVRAVGKEGSGGGEFKAPAAIEADSSGNIWVGDQKNNRVEEFDNTGVYLGQFGSAGGGSGQFSFGTASMGLTTDSLGSIWVADPGHFKMQRWLIPGFPLYSSSIGSSGTGNGKFTTPADVATDTSGNLWVLDQGNNYLQKFNEKGEWLRTAGSAGTGAGKLSSPSALALDSSGNVWIADTANNRIVEFNSTGEFLKTFGTNVNKTKVEAAGTEAEKNICTAASGNVCQAATAGSLAGQLKSPKGIAVTSGGNIWVADTANSRIEKFTPTGSLLNNVSGLGTEPGKLKEPAAIAVAPDGSIWVADTGNNRIEQWNSSLTFVRAVGKEGSGGGEFKGPAAIEADSSGNIWVGDQKNNRIEQFGEGGKYFGQFGAEGSGKFSFGASMGIAVDSGGSIWVTDAGHSKVQKWTQEAPRSEITTILWLDGNQQSGLHGTCKSASCTIEPQWTAESKALSAGTHSAKVKTTDGLGRSAESTVSFQITPDSTKPSLQAGGELVNAPEGWVEQETYGVNATATDSGSGVTSIELKIDGKQVTSVSQSCPDGGCSETLSKQISMASYAGGAHSAEIVATDGAGNTFKEQWTINVDPAGHISTSEAEDTLEALDQTSPVNTVGESKGEAMYEGTAENLGLVSTGGNLVATGSAAPLIIPEATPGEFTVEVAPKQAYTDCPNSAAEESEAQRTGIEEEQLALNVTCTEALPGSVAPADVPITAEPVGASAGSTAQLSENGAAVVAGSVVPNVDLVTRPLYDGGMTFAAIRDATAPDTFSWKVQMDTDQELKLIDSQTAEVHYTGTEHVAFTITATPARDAVGSSVPTSLSVSGDTLTLTVKHKAGSFVYPVVGGAGWEGGVRTYEVALANTANGSGTAEGGEVYEGSGDDSMYREMTIGPPQPGHLSTAPLAVRQEGGPVKERTYNFHDCRFNPNGYNGENPPGTPGNVHREGIKKCHGEESQPTGGYYTISWAVSIHGRYEYKPHGWLWLPVKPECEKWGPEKPAKLRCFPDGSAVGQVYSPKLDVLGFYRFGPGKFGSGSPFSASCYRIDGVLPNYWVRQEGEEPGHHLLEDTFHTAYEYKNPDDKCDWQHLSKIQ